MASIQQSIKNYMEKYFNKKLKLQERLFYLFCFAGVVCSFSAFIAALFSSLPNISVWGSFSCFCIMSILAIYSFKTQDIDRGRLVINIGLNIFLFPVLFFISGGVDSGMMFYFLLGISVISLTLDGLKRIVMLLISMFVYCISIFLAFNYPNLIVSIGESRASDTISSFIIVSLFLCIVMIVVLQEYSHERDKVYKLNQRLERQANIDDLTNLYNRRYLIQYMSNILKKPLEERTMSIVLFDIDDFKKINDKYGHLCGNNVLIRFSEILIEEVGNYGIVSRYGGEEFIVVMPSFTKSKAIDLAERIRIHVSSDKKLFDLVNKITVSGGVEEYTENMTMEKIVKGADTKLYIAKNSGKNKIVS
ncbi:GGDEF domain-containing protein [Clostridioides sp. ZZV15-6598]|uniref:GGDEF domain-containing protein n=1 Tax=Clostridioides sp. ZZV15-6598 TaxID=2811501 RepID=UPI001D0F6E82|nr:GGDEF domain-containing protein [Clostridioides sp. ZZV15-6598]